MDRTSVMNLEIQAFNRNLNNTAKEFSHVAIVEIDLNRKYFTQNGMHINNTGKWWLSKLIATQICRLVKSNSRDESVIVLNWKDESTDKQITVNVNTKSKISSGENNNSQTAVTEKEIIVCRTSGRRGYRLQETVVFMATVSSDSQKS